MGEAIKIQLNNGMVMNATVEGYNAENFTKVLNNQGTMYVNVGDVVINKHMISLVMPVETEEE